MRVLRSSSEEEVAEAFRSAELAGRFMDEIIAGRRGWRIGWLDGLPEAFDWQYVALAPDEVLDILYIDWDWWVKVSAGTRSPRETARRLRAGLIPGGNVEWHRPIAEQLASDDNPPPPLIAVVAPGGPLVLVEGHVRLTAFALFPEYLPDELDVLLGVGDCAHEWWAY